MSRRLKIVAQMFVRNGAPYVERCLRPFAEQGIAVSVVDHGSTDETVALLERHRGAPVCDVMHVPYEGHIDLEQMLLLLREQARRFPADWYVRVDVDEILETDRRGETLADGIERAAAGGADVINFNEFVFVYEDDEVSYAGTDYVKAMRSYYHFAPAPRRLMRAYRADLPVDALASAGHVFPPDRVKLYPGDFVLRHYIALSRARAETKFLTRRYPARSLARGWHHNRVNLTAGQFAAPPAERLLRLPSPDAPLDA